MRHWKKSLLMAALCAVLALGLTIPVFGAGSDSTVYLMAVNERVLVELTAENMPVMVGGVLYVPYTMLVNRDGINLGVNAMYSTTRRTVMVSNGQKGVVFDPQTNTAENLAGEALPVRAMVRNSMIFVPIDYLCEYFGTISCSRIRTQYGTVVRVTSGAAVLDDANFASAADSLLADSLRNYLATVDPASWPGVLTTSQPEPSTAPSQAELYLALRWGEQAEDAVRQLEGRGVRALFLFTCDELRAQDGLVRRLVGAGHTVGLALDGDDGEDCLEQAREGRLLLAAIARYPLLIVSADGLGEEGRGALVQAGYVLWSATSREGDYPTGQDLVEALDPQQVNRVELECGAGGAAFLRRALDAMEEENCRIYQVTAPELA